MSSGTGPAHATSPGRRGVQRRLNAATRIADGVGDDLRDDTFHHLGDAASAVRVLNEAGALTQGEQAGGAAGHRHGRRNRQRRHSTRGCHTQCGGPGARDQAGCLPRSCPRT
jgi:hypothetical protein